MCRLCTWYFTLYWIFCVIYTRTSFTAHLVLVKIDFKNKIQPFCPFYYTTYSDNMLCEIRWSKDEPHSHRHSSSSPLGGGGSSVIAAQPCSLRSPRHHNILIRYLNIIINNIHDDGATAMSAAVDCRSEWAMTYTAPRVF